MWRVFCAAGAVCGLIVVHLVPGSIALGHDQTMTGTPGGTKVTAVADSISLDQNYPNPFNPTTEIRYPKSDI